ncbi:MULTISPECIES: ABC transporter substrate-binding protein [Alkalispirochaeta]|nr:MULTISPECIES: ABC transporter substrate-binding protein [Alkalispirochaeta]
MRKGAFLLVAVCVALALGLGSCGDRGSARREGEPGLVRLTFYYPVGVAGPLARVMNTYVEEFNELHPDIEVVPVYSGDYDPTMQKVQTAVMGGNPPDLFIVEISELPTLLAMNGIEPLSAYASPEYLADFFPAFLENSYDEEGELWGIPFQRSTPVFYWNKEHFAEVGLDPERPPETWQEVREFAGKLNRPGRHGVTISGGWDDWLFQGFVRQNGSELINYRERRVTLNSPEAVEALEFWVALTQEDKVAPPHSTWASTPPDFVAGQTSMLYHSTGVLSFLRNSAQFDFGVAFMPGNVSFGAEVGGGNIHMGRGIPEQNRRAAWKFIEFLTTPELAARWSRDSGYVSVRVSSYDLPDMREYTDRYPEYLVARNQLDYASGKMMAPAFQEIREFLKSALNESTAGNMAPRAALDRAQRQAENLLREWLP